MPHIVGIDLHELDLPFRHAFRHAAAERASSASLFVRYFTDGGHCGYGETLPRPYVTGEERGAAFDLLAERILPRVLGLDFASFPAVHDFLIRCDGKAPSEWVDPRVPQTAAWCAVDLALLDTFGRAFGTELHLGLRGEAPATGAHPWPDGIRYGLVLSGEPGRRTWTTLLKARLYGIRDVKVKVDGPSVAGVRLARRLLGRRARLRVDSNMAWTYDQARRAMALMGRYGVEVFEQPLAADDVEGMARLTAETGRAVMADESFHDAASLERLIAARACTGVNVRIAKCGEKLTETQVLAAIDETLDRRRSDRSFIAAVGQPPKIDREPSYLFLVEYDTPPDERDAARAARELDQALSRHNIEYASKRKSGRLAPAVLRVLERGQFDAYQRSALQAGAPDGQFKILRLTADEAFANHFSRVVRDYRAE